MNQELEYEVRLARKLGRTVAELRRTISAQEFLEQYIYDAREAQRRELALAEAKGR